MSVCHATVLGRTHRLWQQNNQDVALSGTVTQTGSYYGLVLDGCGSKTEHAGRAIPASSEVGARLLGHFAARWLAAGLCQQRPLAEWLPSLYREALAFLETIMSSFPPASEQTAQCFRHTHLLTTLLGFVVTPAEAAFFWQGDGYLCHNGTVCTLQNDDNRPAYLACGLEENNRHHFHVRLLQRDRIRWLAVATDGWRVATLPLLATQRPSLVLQRWLRLQARQRGLFEDDGAVAAYYAAPPEDENGPTATRPS